MRAVQLFALACLAVLALGTAEQRDAGAAIAARTTATVVGGAIRHHANPAWPLAQEPTAFAVEDVEEDDPSPSIDASVPADASASVAARRLLARWGAERLVLDSIAISSRLPRGPPA